MSTPRRQPRRRAKPWYESKTVWFNFIGFLVGMLSLTEVGSIVPLAWAPSIAAFIAVGNFGLRFMTDTAISGKDDP